MNRLYFGDNLKWLSDRNCQSGSDFPDESVDLVYQEESGDVRSKQWRYFR
jgi:hypothetical protein